MSALDAYNIGRYQFASGKYEEARRAFTEAIQANPKYVQAYVGRAEASRELGEYAVALDDLTFALKLRPYYAEAFKIRGITYAAAGQYNEAIADFTRSMNLDAYDAQTFQERSKAFAARGFMAQARADHERALKLDPSIDRRELAKVESKAAERVPKEPVQAGVSWAPPESPPEPRQSAAMPASSPAKQSPATALPPSEIADAAEHAFADYKQPLFVPPVPGVADSVASQPVASPKPHAEPIAGAVETTASDHQRLDHQADQTLPVIVENVPAAAPWMPASAIPLSPATPEPPKADQPQGAEHSDLPGPADHDPLPAATRDFVPVAEQLPPVVAPPTKPTVPQILEPASQNFLRADAVATDRRFEPPVPYGTSLAWNNAPGTAYPVQLSSAEQETPAAAPPLTASPAMFEQLEQLLSQEPGRAEHYGARARLYLQIGDPVRAIDDLGIAIRLQPDQPQHLIARGEALLQAGRTVEATADFDAAISLAPGLPEAYCGRGEAQLAREAWADAADDFAIALRLDPQSVRAKQGQALTTARQSSAVPPSVSSVTNEPISSRHTRFLR